MSPSASPMCGSYFEDPTERKLLTGPTGIGKTYGLAEQIVKTLKDTDGKMGVVVSSTAEQQTLVNYLHFDVVRRAGCG
jgi:ATP-dependent Clp protease ATP-binding subunit ClpA